MPPSCPLVRPIVTRIAGTTEGRQATTEKPERSAPTAMNPPDDTKTEIAFPTTNFERGVRLDLLQQVGEDSGYFEALGDSHWAVFNEDGSTLVISFDRLEDIQALEPGKMPDVFGQATQNGWSHLSLISEGDTWYRDKAVFAYMDRLVDACFFDEYDQVVFYGTGMGAYAATAFSVTAPGCTVLAVQPRATLSPEMAIWETRYRDARRLNFTDRYGYAPDMTEGTKKVFTLHDPYNSLDAMHVALFRKPYVTPLKAPFIGENIGKSLAEMGILSKLLKAACEGKLTETLYNRLWRERRSNGNYLRWIMRACADAGHPQREAMICRSVINRIRAPGFRNHLARLEKSGVLDKT